jgi:hypothetical protein
MTTGPVLVETGKLQTPDVLALAELQLGQVIAEANKALIELGHLGHRLDRVPGGEAEYAHGKIVLTVEPSAKNLEKAGAGMSRARPQP